jgi:hypothetical protein
MGPKKRNGVGSLGNPPPTEATPARTEARVWSSPSREYRANGDLRIKTLVIPTGAGAHATAEWRNPLFLPFSSPWNRGELSKSNFPFRKTNHQLTIS